MRTKRKIATKLGKGNRKANRLKPDHNPHLSLSFSLSVCLCLSLSLFLCVAEVSATHYNSTPYGVVVVVVVVLAKLKNGITFERLEIST